MRWALLLSGGTALGAVQPPIARALEERLGPPSAVAGVSIGANVAALVGEGRHDDLDAIMRACDGTRYFQAPSASPWNGLFSLRPLRRLHDRWDTCRDLRCPTYVGLVDAATRAYRTIRLDTLNDLWDRRDAVVGSSTQPLVHRHWRHRGRWVLDGGIAHVLPLLPGWAGFDEIHAVFCSPVGGGRRKPPDRPQRQVAQAWEQAEVALEMMLDRIAVEDFRRIRRWSGTVRVVAYAPESWEQVGRSFDARAETMARRLDQVGPSMLASPIFERDPATRSRR